MSEYQGEPSFDEDVEEAANAFYRAERQLQIPRAYVLSERELEKFKEAQLALRWLNEKFDSERTIGDSQ